MGTEGLNLPTNFGVCRDSSRAMAGRFCEAAQGVLADWLATMSYQGEGIRMNIQSGRRSCM
jgi:hypothetical protein